MKKSDVQRTAQEQTIDEIFKPTADPARPDTVPAGSLGLTCPEAHVDSILSEGESV